MNLKIYTLAFLSASFITSLQAQDYLISFAGSGAISTVATVKVENLKQGTELTMNGSDILHLKNVVTGIESYIEDSNQRISFSPNPMIDYSLIRFDLPEDGQTTTSLYDITGRIILQVQDYLSKGCHTYRIQGIKNGFYITKVISDRYSVSGRLLCSGSHKADPKIIYENAGVADKKEYDLKGISSETVMQYNEGDRLKLTGISDIYSTVITDVPTESKTITFDFIACTDAGGNNYPIVRISSQIWMAKNLAYLPSVNPSASGSNSDPYYYVYDYQGSSVTEAKATSNYQTYGVLYNWNAALSACPSGWHLPTDEEWTALENYLIANGYNYDGTTTGNKIAKSLATSGGWLSSTYNGGVGNADYPDKRNKTGFSALPGGIRYSGGSFQYVGEEGYWWSSSEHYQYSFFRHLIYNGSTVLRTYYGRHYGFSVRCLRD